MRIAEAAERSSEVDGRITGCLDQSTDTGHPVSIVRSYRRVNEERVTIIPFGINSNMPTTGLTRSKRNAAPAWAQPRESSTDKRRLFSVQEILPSWRARSRRILAAACIGNLQAAGRRSDGSRPTDTRGRRSEGLPGRFMSLRVGEGTEQACDWRTA
jgi:hypothetical protein